MKETTTRAAMLTLVMDLIGESVEEVAQVTGRQCMDCPVMSALVHKLRKALLLEEEEIAEEMRERYGFISRS
jgi:hypothetical protein